MDFTYNEEQRMLTDSLRRLMADGWAFEQRRERAAQTELNTASWQSLADVGVTGLIVPEEHGGFGESPATLVATQLELGRGLVAEPVIPSAVISTALLAHSDNEAVQAECLPSMAGGELVLALAYLEGNQHNNQTPQATQASKGGAGFVLNGAKKLVWAGGQAHKLIISAVLDGETALFLVDGNAQGLSRNDYPTMDGQRCAYITLDGVEVAEQALIAQGAAAEAALDAGIGYGVLALCAHAAGAMQRLVEITAEYLKTRQQFKRPLADFQALQFYLADMLIKQEVAISMAYVAAMGLGETDAEERQRLLSSAKVAVAEAGRFVGQTAVQLHGGIGVTHELEVGDFFKRLTFADYLLGDSDHHLNQLEALYQQED